MASALLQFSGVGRCVWDGSRRRVVLDGVSFEVGVGDFVGVWGPRGSGKSTLLRIAAGLEVADQGRVFFDGVDLTGLSGDERARVLRDGVGFVPADWLAYRNRLACEHVALAATAGGTVTLKRARAAARRALGRVGASECCDRRMGELSLSERVRVELARGLVRSPRLLIVDEPPLLHSPGEGDDLYGLLRSLGSERDLAVLVASSDLDLVGGARRVMTLSRGRLRPRERPATIIKFPEQRAGSGR
jgi:lipoprotein-releasing system ATP-binding protein